MGAMADELVWLKANPDFEERPATLDEFLGPLYLNLDDTIRDRIREELVEIMGTEVSGTRIAKYSEALLTGGIGIGKTTVAAIVLTYMAHWVLCLKNPQKFFNLMPGSRIAFMQMSTSEKQALEVVFGDIKARIQHSPWFQKYPYDTNFTKSIRFDKDIWIIPGDSSETTFEGYNILGGIVDEGDSHKVTERKDYAEQGYTTISSRITSRFQDRGCLVLIGQMKRANGFMARKYKLFKQHSKKYAVRLAIWESMGKEFYRDDNGEYKFFYYDVKRKQIVPPEFVAATGTGDGTYLEIPELYREQFMNDPEKALRDLAGIPQAVSDPFISLVNRIEECRDRWIESYGPESPYDDGKFAPWFAAEDTLPRVAHLDIAYSGDGDALGLAMGHVREMVEDEDGELKPYIVIDALIRIKAPSGGEIMLADVRQIIYALRDVHGFNLQLITADGFESTDTMQQLRRRRFRAEYLSVDRKKLPYQDLKDAIYEGRIEFPPYIVTIRKESGAEDVEILVKELSELVDDGRKIDHPIEGSKDLADAVAGVTTTLMSNRRYRRSSVKMDQERHNQAAANRHMPAHHAVVRDFTPPRAPVPPQRR
jgi:hypothetical protein